MTNRSANATIKGYFYQFDHTIAQILNAEKNTSITIEGIEDIDLDNNDEGVFVQCKYYEGSDYNHSTIKDAVIQMLKHFHSQGCPENKSYKYRLYGHYKSGQTKLDPYPTPLDVDFLKNNLLSFTREKIEHKVYEQLAISTKQLETFRDILEININAPSYDDQQKSLIELLTLEIAGCTTEDAKYFYYPNSINIIQALAIQKDEEKRKITKASFVKELNRKDLIFTSWLQQKFDNSHYAKLVRRTYFRFGSTRVPKASRFFIIDADGEYNTQRMASMLSALGDFFSHKELKRTPQEDRFTPYVFIRNLTEQELIDLKKSLWRQGLKFIDGYPFRGADFSSSLIAKDPTAENLLKLKIISDPNQLLQTIISIQGSAIEIYDFYKKTPIEDHYFPPGHSSNPIKCNSPYFVHEVIKS